MHRSFLRLGIGDMEMQSTVVRLQDPARRMDRSIRWVPGIRIGGADEFKRGMRERIHSLPSDFHPSAHDHS